MIENRQTGPLFHLPQGVFGQRFADGVLVYDARGGTHQLSERDAAAWIAVADGRPVAAADGESLSARKLAAPRLPANSPTALDLPECRQRAEVRWRREGIGAVYLADTSSRLGFRPRFLTGPAALFWEVMCERGTRAAHAGTVERFGAAWSSEESLGLLADLARERLLLMPGGADIGPSTGVLSRELDTEDVSARIRSTETPWYLLWEVTYACNLRCITCYATEHGKPASLFATLDGAKDFIRKLVEARIFHVTLIGGEPFAWPHLADVVDELKKSHIYVKIVTNGTLITDATISRLVESGINQMDISVDGFTPDENDPVRGAGSFEEIRRGIRAAIDGGVPKVLLSMTTGRHNIDALQTLPERARDVFGVSEVFLTRLICSGSGRSLLTWRSERDHTARLRRLLDEVWPKRCPEVRVWTQRWVCDCGRTRMVVSPEGAVRPCTFHGGRVGDLRDGLLPIWREAAGFDMIRHPWKHNPLCESCDDRLDCRGTACSARVFARDGRLISTDCIRQPEVIERYGA